MPSALFTRSDRWGSSGEIDGVAEKILGGIRRQIFKDAFARAGNRRACPCDARIQSRALGRQPKTRRAGTLFFEHGIAMNGRFVKRHETLIDGAVEQVITHKKR